jgi:hypothetical protein
VLIRGAVRLGAKRRWESGESPELPRSGKQERTLQDKHWFSHELGSREQVGSLQVRRPATLTTSTVKKLVVAWTFTTGLSVDSIAVAIIGFISRAAMSQRVIVLRLFASDFQWRSVRYLDVHKTDDPTIR